jgi:hypothetical protein
MFKPLLRAAASIPLLVAFPLAAQQPAPIAAADMLRHIQVLASDQYQGRAPAGEGERLTMSYISEQLRARGLEPAGEGGTWFQPVALVDRATRSQEASWTANGRALPFDLANIALQGRDPDVRTADARIVFAGHGARIPARGIDQLAGADLGGAIVFILFDAPDLPGFPSFAERVRTVTEAGAAAVIGVTGGDLAWRYVVANFHSPTTKFAALPTAPIVGAMPASAVQALFASGGADFRRLLNDQPGSSFRATTLPLHGSLHVQTDVRRYTTNNVIGRIRGSRSTGENVMFLAHWDHFGLCRPEGAADRICNGAVDNASGVAMMIEVAGHLALGPRPVRDVIVMATTAEEEGLLGAEYFAGHPTVPLGSIVAAVNLDTVAIAPAGEPVAILNRGVPGLDALVASTAAAMGRRMDSAHEADAMAERQDGWALARHGVPAIMVGGSFAGMARLNAFLQGRYHQPSDQAEGIEMGGATEDANLLVTLGRRLADPAAYARPQRTAE